MVYRSPTILLILLILKISYLYVMRKCKGLTSRSISHKAYTIKF